MDEIYTILRADKPFGLTAEPDISVHRIDKSKDLALIIASDGLWPSRSTLMRSSQSSSRPILTRILKMKL